MSIGLVVALVIAFTRDWWFPSTASQSAVEYDSLFLLFSIIIGFAFVGTQLLLAISIWKFGKRDGRQAWYVPGSLRLEAAWTIVPTIILAALAIYQMESWAAAKINRPPGAPLAEVTGRQFQWDFRYPGPDGRLHTDDDLVTTDGVLHVPVGETIVLALHSKDVIHSFFVPALRLKQDLVPGIDHEVWFTPDTEGEFDIICAELCGWGHSQMRGRLVVESPEAYVTFLDELTTAQRATNND